MENYSIGQKVSDRLVKVCLNNVSEDDYIILDANDAGIVDKFGAFIAWIKAKEAEIEKIDSEFKKKYGEKEPIIENQDGSFDVDTDQIMERTGIKLAIYREEAEKIDEIFGKDTLHMYFREIYEAIPDFVPDEECITDFLEEITPILETIYNQRLERINSKYNRGRKGKHSKTKQELIDQFKKGSHD